MQRRASAGSRSAGQLAEQFPAHFIAFDLLQVDGEELLTTRYGERRDLLARLFAEHGIGPPWTLCPETDDVRVAQEWLSTWTDVPGVEGIVVRDRRQRYVPGARGWCKIRRRDTTEAVVGAVTGTVEHPQTLVLGRYDEEGVLRAVARSTPLHPDRARSIGAQLAPAGPGHAWEGVRFTTSWRSHTPLDVRLVEPEQVAEMSVDTARAGGVWRHPVRVVRLRADMTPAEVPTMNSGAAGG
ncbi:ATP-dependent DNA ligase [Streptomyces bauhiniae]|uniref:ATP-dependent DNA ligase n=1 Tax=Streptomyces bauhiniae TaxID=2340725 RepID=UPI0036CAFBA9